METQSTSVWVIELVRTSQKSTTMVRGIACLYGSIRMYIVECTCILVFRTLAVLCLVTGRSGCWQSSGAARVDLFSFALFASPCLIHQSANSSGSWISSERDQTILACVTLCTSCQCTFWSCLSLHTSILTVWSVCIGVWPLISFKEQF